MPTAPGFADVGIEMRQTGVTRPAYITFGVNPTATDPLAVATSVATAINASSSLKSFMDTSVTITAIRVSMGTDGAADLVGIGTVSITGAMTYDALPSNCAVLVHKLTARGGRRGRGRFFIPWAIGEPNVDQGGILEPTWLTPIQTGCSNFLTALTTNAVPMVLLHDVGLSPPGAPDVVTSLSVDGMISTQRRRLGRR